ncbi:MULTISPECIES: hypothetical protein [Pimelobacter]|uniref:hypothetical protein n=1 Tax=Pimelobacter TaxID=2044 RepID=UPI001C05D89B|nr:MULTISPECIES: hypothetical protein [Pimelobacter]MBU2698867.1 hypothetical protein [Pimelobacter sp. 30-1]UUW92999.1 hypothetical protein M0M43_30665 [Pimelobacter simplex]UUW99032.1 hypothetical protein M0M48_30685 [Pimelobacter simplex]
MSWETVDGTHECYVLPEFADGARGANVSGLGEPANHVVVAFAIDADTHQRVATAVRPASEVVGWRVCCDCRDSLAGPIRTMWVGPLVDRVDEPDQAGPGRVFLADGDVVNADAIDPAPFYDAWVSGHVPDAITA